MLVFVPNSTAQEPVGYGCFSEPIVLGDALVLEHPGPIHVILCPDPWDPPCTKAPSPYIEDVLADGTSSAIVPNEMRILGVIPDEDGSP